MNLVEYGRILIRRGWIMVLLAVIVAGAAYLFSQQVTPVYRATQNILIVPSRSDFGLTQAAIQLLNNRRAYLDSGLRAATVIDRLQLDMRPQFLLSRTTIAPNRDSLVIQIDVDLEDPQVASAVAREWGQELVRYQDELNQTAQREDRIRAEPQDDPQVRLLRPDVRINTVIGAIAGFFLGAVIVFVLEFLESAVIRSHADIERAVELPVLAAVPPER